jgi:hypothetical protein
VEVSVDVLNRQAVSKLKEALRPLSIEPKLEVREIDQASFEANPSESNRIWIAHRWRGADGIPRRSFRHLPLS